MTSETSFREKGRAAFLAALVVMSVFAMAASLPGAVAAQDETLDAGSSNINEDDVWIGQEVEISNLSSPADLMQDSDTVQNLRVNNDSATIDTSELDEGRYYIQHGEGEEPAETGVFWVNEHNVNVDFEDSTVEQGDNVTLNYEDTSDEPRNDSDVEVHVSAELGNETVGQEDLESILPDGESVEGEDDTVAISDLSEGVEADFSEQDTGNYEFTVDVTDTTAEDTAEITVGEEPETDAQFDESTYEENVGDVAEFEIEHDGTDNLTVNMTDEEEFYTASIEITGVEGEDNVTVQYNTYLAGHGNGDEVVTVLNDEGEELTGENVEVNVTEELENDENQLGDDERLLPGDYELEVFPGTADETEDETDAAVLLLEERSTGDMNTWALAGDDFDAAGVDLEDIEDSAVSTDSVADEDRLVVGVEASGIYGYALDDDGNWDGHETLELEFEDTEEPRYGDADSFTLDDISNDQVIVDEDEDRFFVVVDADEVVDEDDEEIDETWNVTFSVSEDNDYVDDEETVETQFNVEEAFVELVGDQDEDDRFQIDNSNESELTAETNLAPGTDGDFRLRTTSEVYTSDAEVDGDGVLTTTFNLSGHEAGDEIQTLRVTAGDEPEHEAEGVFVSADGDDQPDKKDGFKLDASAPSEVNLDDNATLDVTVVNNNDEAGNATLEVTVGDEEYTEELELDTGDSVTESFDFDTSEEGDIDWSVETPDDSDSGTLTVSDKVKENGEANGANGDNGANGGNGDNGDNGDDANGADDGEDDETVPGFGVAVAIVALLGAAMLATRRQN
ncbi:PGF-CTERM sorting domain-containing protein [Natronococcus sp. JC468]|uniref:BGTF surface domain-containing protein n=1 Tax=Natronococcus sp. JC468 TaxID=1961921 RepID=UPI001439C8D1|nr:BGTF surface domain-containing protein [Natronococcus sp. JC468]NKE36496.1 PGF-CTERM sorting domain-containing protein [Natronococcus sp. JC468]